MHGYNSNGYLYRVSVLAMQLDVHLLLVCRENKKHKLYNKLQNLKMEKR